MIALSSITSTMHEAARLQPYRNGSCQTNAAVSAAPIFSREAPTTKTGMQTFEGWELSDDGGGEFIWQWAGGKLSEQGFV